MTNGAACLPPHHTCAIARSPAAVISIGSNRRPPNALCSHAPVAMNPGTPGRAQAGGSSAAGDTIYALCGPDVYLLLVEDRGWTPDRYQDWLTAQLIRGLLRDP